MSPNICIYLIRQNFDYEGGSSWQKDRELPYNLIRIRDNFFGAISGFGIFWTVILRVGSGIDIIYKLHWIVH